ncbi:hypothetical protein H2198_000545 [Neophaeococcomyces mojaviensis]|uniref:Uncharacterized protein n=1 Tax=Neophaeococcomyces mojaviensis TaxID=3383035 RepID=A0ACC3AJQ7_9EURO|nr:hypothetical protein H2198_000545 [Knufia sp. JES_112]
MPFDFKKFDVKCASMSIDELQREWEHYTRLISGSATSTAVSGAAIPFTLGVSVIGVGLAAPAIHNARKKREIIERHLNRHGTTHVTRKRDVLTPMAISGTVGLVTLGIGSAGADAVTNAAAEHGFSSVAANEIAVKAGVHLAVDGLAMAGEEHHMKQKRLAEAHNAWLRQQWLPGQPKQGDGTPGMNSYHSTMYGEDSKMVSQNISNAGPNALLPMASPIPISPSPPSPYANPPGYFPSSQNLYQEKSPLPSYSTTPFMDNQGYPPPPTYSEKPVFYDASKLGSELVQPQHATPASMTCSSTLYQDESQCKNSETPLNTNMPTVCKPVPWPQPESISSPTNQTQGLQGSQCLQATYPTPLAHQAPQPMYPSYPGTMVPNSASQQSDGLDHAMQRLSIASSAPPPPPVQSPATAPRQNSLAATPQYNPASPPYQHYQPSENMTSYFPPPPPSPAISTISSNPYTSYSVQPLVPSNAQSQSHGGSMSNPYPTPSPTPGALSQYSSPPQNLDAACNTYPAPSQTLEYTYNRYSTPAPTPANLPVSSPRPYNNFSLSPQSNLYFPPPPSTSGQRLQQQSPTHVQTQHGAYGYPTPLATPLQKSEGGTYFPPPPTTPFTGRW